LVYGPGLLETERISLSMNSTNSELPLSKAKFIAFEIFERFFIISFSRRWELSEISSIFLSFSANSAFFSKIIRSLIAFCFLILKKLIVFQNFPIMVKKKPTLYSSFSNNKWLFCVSKSLILATSVDKTDASFLVNSLERVN